MANGYVPFAIRYSHSPERIALAACFVSLCFAGLVVLARSLNPIPSRTRPLNSSAPMVLWLKPWESRSLPGLPRTKQFLFTCHKFNLARSQTKTPLPFGEAAFLCPASGAPRDFRPSFSASLDFKFIGSSFQNAYATARVSSDALQPEETPPCVSSFVPP